VRKGVLFCMEVFVSFSIDFLYNFYRVPTFVFIIDFAYTFHCHRCRCASVEACDAPAPEFLPVDEEFLEELVRSVP
jgi:hypothetical protein